jgi:hypothetical protein
MPSRLTLETTLSALLPHLWCGQMLHTWLTSGTPPSGHFTCILAISPSIHEASQQLGLPIIWHIFPLYVSFFINFAIWSCPLQLPNNLQDIYVDIFGEATSSDVHTHLKRELMQAIWRLLLDGKFMEAYEHGIVIRCSDGITRRVFPRFFSYSADYPEK